MRKTAVYILFFSLLLTGCYHAQITTGLQESDEVYEDKWADGFIYGLVPPDFVEAGRQCSNGVARVETRLSFMNQFVTFLSGGIYAPMEIRVTCASSMVSADENRILDLADTPSDEERLEKIGTVFTEQSGSGDPFYIRFR